MTNPDLEASARALADKVAAKCIADWLAQPEYSSQTSLLDLVADAILPLARQAMRGEALAEMVIRAWDARVPVGRGAERVADAILAARSERLGGD